MRALRLGDRGKDVAKLQKFLRLSGYDLGAEDYYGYLTKYAVIHFQREHGLVADGIAGKRFFALAFKPDLPLRRRIHIVESGENIKEIAQKNGVGQSAFRQSKRWSKIFPGQRLLFFEREVWGLIAKPLTAEVPRELTGFVYADLQLKSESLRPCVSQAETVNKKTFTDLKEQFSGVYLSHLPGKSYQRRIKRARRILGRSRMLWVELTPETPHRSYLGGVDYASVNKLANRVVVSFAEPSLPGPALASREFVEQFFARVFPEIFPWKVILKIPLYALEWREVQGEMVSKKRPCSSALAKAFRHGARLEQDQATNWYYRYQSRGEQFKLYLPHLNQINEILSLTNRYNLAGILLDNLGMEDPRFWELLFNYFALARLDFF